MEMTFTKVKIMATFESKGEKDNGQDIQKVSLHFHCSVLKLRDRYIIIHYMILHNFCMFKIFHNKKLILLAMCGICGDESTESSSPQEVLAVV